MRCYPIYKRSDFTKPAYKTAEIMEILNISYSTIKNYDKQGKLPIQRTETGRRVVLREDLLNYLDSLKMLIHDDETKKHDVIYARVSSKDKLEEIIKFLKDHKDDSLSTKEILELIEKDDTENDYF